MGEITKFIMFIGPISSVFDYTTFAVMWFIFKCSNSECVTPPELATRFGNERAVNHTYAAALFQTGWFVESIMTQTLIIHVIRTNLIPFIQSRSRLPAFDDDDSHHAYRRVSAVFAAGGSAGVCSFAAALLADPAGDAVVLRRPDASRQDLADPQILGLMQPIKVNNPRSKLRGISDSKLHLPFV